MSFLTSLIKKRASASLALQALFTALAFALMVAASYFFVAEIERRHLANDARGALSYAQAKIEADLDQAAILAAGIAHTMRGLILNGATLGQIQAHFKLMDDFGYRSNVSGFDGFFGHFEAYGGVNVNAASRYLPEGVAAEGRPWYIAAENAKGEPAITDPYFSLNTKNLVLTYVSRIYGDDGRPLCIVGMNITFDGIAQHVSRISELAQTKGTGAYGVLHDKNAMILVHPNKNLIGKKMADVTGSAGEIAGELARRGEVDELEALNNDGEKVIVFFKTMGNGWQIGVMTLKTVYYRNMRAMALYISALGALLAAILIYILLGITKAKRRADEFTRIVFDAMPLACDLWDSARRNISCNEEAARLCGARGKQDYLEKFFDFSPEYQPSGRRSRDMCREYVDRAFAEGYYRGEWMHKTWDGRPLPCEVTLVRITYKGDLAVLAYKRDLREEKAALDRIRDADERAHSMFDASPLGITMWDVNGNMIDCNMEAARIAGVSGKREYIDRFHELTPEYQSDGRKSRAALTEAFVKTFKEGYCRLDWEHGTAQGEIVPFDLTLVRLKYREGYAAVSYARDLRELRAAMEKTREADERIQSIFNATPLAITIWNPETRALVDCNMEAVRIVGLTDKKTYIEKFIGMTPERQPNGQKTADMVSDIFDKTMSEGITRYDWVQLSASGEAIPFQCNTVRIRHTGKYMIISYAQDMRELHAAMEKTREADERAIMMLDAAPIGITLWDREMNLIDFNYEAARVVGIDNKPEYRKRFGELTPEFQPDGRKSADALAAFFGEAFREGRAAMLWHHNDVDGHGVPFDATAIRLKLKYRDEDVVMVCCRDLRELYAADAKSRKAEERARILLDAAPVGCILFGDDNEAIDCNPEALKLFGVGSKKEFLDAGFATYSPERQPDGTPTGEKIEAVSRAAHEKGVNRFEWEHVNAAGEAVPCEVTLLRVRYQEKEILAGYMRDLREYKARMEERHRAEIAEESNKAKSRFLAAMSHEIRTPMNVILGVTEIQLQDDYLPPHLREAFLQIYNSSSLLLGIINDILDLSKIEAGKMEFTPAPYKLASLINDTVHLNMMRNSKPIEFELEIDEGAPANLYGDELRIKQILNNLLSNAFKFTGEGRIKLSVAVEDEFGGAGERGVTLVFSVSDTGQGMTEEQLGALFSEYTRFNLSANRAIQGTGLGMNITRDLVNMMGGEITVDSAFGSGTTVNVRLPQRTAGAERIGGELAESMRRFRVNATNLSRSRAVTREYMPYGRVLIVDDVESNLYVAKGLMSPYGLSVDTVSSGARAVEKVQSGEAYDVIFMDHMMPVMDGMEAAKLIREHGYANPIVALTANAVVGQAEMFLSSGFDDFISKPIDIRQLNAVLNRLVRDRHPQDVVEGARAEKDRIDRTNAAYTPAAAAPELLAIFARDAERAVSAMEALLKGGGGATPEAFNLFTVSAHAMKSALANIGELRLSQTAFALERAGKSGDMNAVSMRLPGFLKALREIVSGAEAAGRAKTSAEKDEDPKFLREQLAVIGKACADYDERAVNEALDKLKKMSWTAETEEALDKVAQLLLHSDFEVAAGFAADFMGKIKI